MQVLIMRCVFRYLVSMACVAVAAPALAQAPNHLRRVAVLNPTRPCPPSPLLLDSLAKLGWVEGRTIVIDCVSLTGRLLDAPTVARDLIARRPDVVVRPRRPPHMR